MASFSAQADVINKGEHGFSLRITSEVDAKPDDVYQQFLRIHEWWIADHTWFGDANNLTLEAKAGGCFCEKSEGREVLHMLVSFVLPNQEIKWLGGLGPLQGMGLHGAMSWRFEPSAQGTQIIQTYNVSGYTTGGLQALAPIVDQVQSQQQAALVAKLQSR